MCISQILAVALGGSLITALQNYGTSHKVLVMSWIKFTFLALLVVFLFWVCVTQISSSEVVYICIACLYLPLCMCWRPLTLWWKALQTVCIHVLAAVPKDRQMWCYSDDDKKHYVAFMYVPRPLPLLSSPLLVLSSYQSLRLRQCKAVRRKIQWLFLSKTEGLGEREMLKESRRKRERVKAWQTKRRREWKKGRERNRTLEQTIFKVMVWVFRLRGDLYRITAPLRTDFVYSGWEKKRTGEREGELGYHKESHLVLHHAHTAPQLSSSFTLFLHQSQWRHASFMSRDLFGCVISSDNCQ